MFSNIFVDAQKRKHLPAWIREGLEKMEREKQKKMEKEKKEQEMAEAQKEREEAEKEAAEEIMRERGDGQPAVPKKSRFVSCHGNFKCYDTVVMVRSDSFFDK